MRRLNNFCEAHTVQHCLQSGSHQVFHVYKNCIFKSCELFIGIHSMLVYNSPQAAKYSSAVIHVMGHSHNPVMFSALRSSRHFCFTALAYLGLVLLPYSHPITAYHVPWNGPVWLLFACHWPNTIHHFIQYFAYAEDCKLPTEILLGNQSLTFIHYTTTDSCIGWPETISNSVVLKVRFMISYATPMNDPTYSSSYSFLLRH